MALSRISITAAAMLAIMATSCIDPPSGERNTISLERLASRYGFTTHSPTNTAITLTHREHGTTLTFRAGTRRMRCNDQLYWLNWVTTTHATGFQISTTDLHTVIRPLLETEAALHKLGRDIVVLDPGHGGNDAGAIAPHNTFEKTIVLEIAQHVQTILQEAGITVHMTRDQDQTVPLTKRPQRAREWNADLFVSIHANKASNRTVRGIETFVMPAAGYPSTTSSQGTDTVFAGNTYDAANTLLAGAIHKALLTHLETSDRGVKRARFVVLREATCPATLVEVGFLSHPTELKQLRTPDYRKRIANGIAKGILAYLTKVGN